MGQHQQSSVSLTGVDELYRVIQIWENGNVLLKDKKTGDEFLLRAFSSYLQDQVTGFNKLIGRRQKLKCTHLLDLAQVHQKQYKNTCSILHKVFLLMEYPFKNLKEQIIQRKAQQPPRFFTESQLLSIVYSCCIGLQTLYANNFPHEALSAEEIFIDRSGLIKISDPLLLGLQNNYITVLKNNQDSQELNNKKHYHISPEIMNFLEDYNFFYYDKGKSDVFVLGCIMLEAALLTQFDFYDFKSKKVELFKISQLLGQLRGIRLYSDFLIDTLCSMLTIEPRHRPSFTSIIDNVEQFSSISSSIVYELGKQAGVKNQNSQKGYFHNSNRTAYPIQHNNRNLQVTPFAIFNQQSILKTNQNPLHASPFPSITSNQKVIKFQSAQRKFQSKFRTSEPQTYINEIEQSVWGERIPTPDKITMNNPLSSNQQFRSFHNSANGFSDGKDYNSNTNDLEMKYDRLNTWNKIEVDRLNSWNRVEVDPISQQKFSYISIANMQINFNNPCRDPQWGVKNYGGEFHKYDYLQNAKSSKVQSDYRSYNTHSIPSKNETLFGEGQVSLNKQPMKPKNNTLQRKLPIFSHQIPQISEILSKIKSNQKKIGKAQTNTYSENIISPASIAYSSSTNSRNQFNHKYSNSSLGSKLYQNQIKETENLKQFKITQKPYNYEIISVVNQDKSSINIDQIQSSSKRSKQKDKDSSKQQSNKSAEAFSLSSNSNLKSAQFVKDQTSIMNSLQVSKSLSLQKSKQLNRPPHLQLNKSISLSSEMSQNLSNKELQSNDLMRTKNFDQLQEKYPNKQLSEIQELQLQDYMALGASEEYVMSISNNSGSSSTNTAIRKYIRPSQCIEEVSEENENLNTSHSRSPTSPHLSRHNLNQQNSVSSEEQIKEYPVYNAGNIIKYSPVLKLQTPFSIQSQFSSQCNKHLTLFSESNQSPNNTNYQKKPSQFKLDQEGKDKDKDKGQFIMEELPGGGRYQGFKLNGKKQGQGRLYFKDGGFYQGQWKDNKMAGFGKLYYDNHQIAYEGFWLQDQFSGKGRVFNDRPQNFQGSFGGEDFTELMDKWIYYEGQFEKDAKHGTGKIKLSNGEVFQGSFFYDVIEGEGCFYRLDGTLLSGYWKENIYIGQKS